MLHKLEENFQFSVYNVLVFSHFSATLLAFRMGPVGEKLTVAILQKFPSLKKAHRGQEWEKYAAELSLTSHYSIHQNLLIIEIFSDIFQAQKCQKFTGFSFSNVNICSLFLSEQNNKLVLGCWPILPVTLNTLHIVISSIVVMNTLISAALNLTLKCIHLFTYYCRNNC